MAAQPSHHPNARPRPRRRPGPQLDVAARMLVAAVTAAAVTAAAAVMAVVPLAPVPTYHRYPCVAGLPSGLPSGRPRRRRLRQRRLHQAPRQCTGHPTTLQCLACRCLACRCLACLAPPPTTDRTPTLVLGKPQPHPHCPPASPLQSTCQRVELACRTTRA